MLSHVRLFHVCSARVRAVFSLPGTVLKQEAQKAHLPRRKTGTVLPSRVTASMSSPS